MLFEPGTKSSRRDVIVDHIGDCSGRSGLRKNLRDGYALRITPLLASEKTFVERCPKNRSRVMDRVTDECVFERRLARVCLALSPHPLTRTVQSAGSAALLQFAA